jgi:hypothetical protein
VSDNYRRHYDEATQAWASPRPLSTSEQMVRALTAERDHYAGTLEAERLRVARYEAALRAISESDEYVEMHRIARDALERR